MSLRGSYSCDVSFAPLISHSDPVTEQNVLCVCVCVCACVCLWQCGPHRGHTPCTHLVISMCPDNQLNQWALLKLSPSVCLIFSQMKTKSRIVSLYRRVRRRRPTTGGKAQVRMLAFVFVFLWLQTVKQCLQSM